MAPTLKKSLKGLKKQTNNLFEAQHWTQLSESDLVEWKAIAPNFTPQELASKGDGSIKIEKEALRLLQMMRDRLNRPIIVNSAYRDLVYNDKVRGKKTSQHLNGKAFDLHIRSQAEGKRFEELAAEIGFTAIGRYKTFIHIDNRPPKVNGGGYRWGTWDL